jgi:hypothetical protein
MFVFLLESSLRVVCCGGGVLVLCCISPVCPDCPSDKIRVKRGKTDKEIKASYLARFAKEGFALNCLDCCGGAK